MDLLKKFISIVLVTLLAVSQMPLLAQGSKSLTVEDIMKFRHVKSPSISNDGNWVAHTSKPDRGDSEVLVYSTRGKKQFSIPQGENPVISNDGNWVAAVHTVSAEDELKLKLAKEGGPKRGLALLNTSTGEQSLYKRVQSFAFSNDSKWLAYLDLKEENTSDREEKEDKKKSPDKPVGSQLNLIWLKDESSHSIPYVTRYSIDSTSRYLVYEMADSNGKADGVYLVDLENTLEEPTPIFTDSNAWSGYFRWNNRTGELAFLGGVRNKKFKPTDTELFTWKPGNATAEVVLNDEDLEEGWKLYHKNTLRWTIDGKRLFLGIKPETEIIKPEKEKKDTVSKLFDPEAILSDRTLDVWHWNDPYINSNQKIRWDRVKDKTYTGVFFPGTRKFIPLADEEMTDIGFSENPTTILGASNLPYRKRRTWDNSLKDYYLVDIASGEKKLVLEEQGHTVKLSPDGKWLVYFRSGDWHLLETASILGSGSDSEQGSGSDSEQSSGSDSEQSSGLYSGPKPRNLTQDLPVTFADEDWDYPAEAPGYGVGDWLNGSEAVLVYDKFDIWMFPTRGDNPVCLTEGRGRNEKLQFRIKRLDNQKQYLSTGEQVFLTAYHDLEKYTAIFSMEVGVPGVARGFEGPHRYTLLSKAHDAENVLFTRESYNEYPDLWVTGMNFKKARKLSDVNPQKEEFAWGEAELVEWSSEDGKPLQGILIKPGNYQPGEKYPVLVYYYRFFTDRLYEFNEVVINHRPCFPFYASNGYAVFLPDIRFEVGSPGSSATKCLVPGVEKIIDMGIADPDAVCLHGHSWSGYQTAFVITQTDIFACAIAGAPVSNMTSAYSGIRWETGLARQFQYEKQQSRIGASLWEARDKYIENSPVFFADHINTPLLIQFGDQDGAVPWYQGIELYLAMRRFEKDCVFLQYRNEPHHLKQYANKLDYTLKFKAYLDHYLKGDPAEDWIRTGVPYNGK